MAWGTGRLCWVWPIKCDLAGTLVQTFPFRKQSCKPRLQNAKAEIVGGKSMGDLYGIFVCLRKFGPGVFALANARNVPAIAQTQRFSTTVGTSF